jgi:endonuclease III-like uncharacterized protein
MLGVNKEQYAMGNEEHDTLKILSSVIEKTIDKHLSHKEAVCPNGMTKEKIKELNDLTEALTKILPDLQDVAQIVKTGKLTARGVFWGCIGLGFATLFCIGLYERLKPLLASLSRMI